MRCVASVVVAGTNDFSDFNLCLRKRVGQLPNDIALLGAAIWPASRAKRKMTLYSSCVQESHTAGLAAKSHLAVPMELGLEAMAQLRFIQISKKTGEGKDLASQTRIPYFSCVARAELPFGGKHLEMEFSTNVADDTCWVEDDQQSRFDG